MFYAVTCFYYHYYCIVIFCVFIITIHHIFLEQILYFVHLLISGKIFPGEDRGPVLEVIVSRTNFISSHTSKKLRVIGLSTALANAKDLADWLGIGQVIWLRFFVLCCWVFLYF